MVERKTYREGNVFVTVWEEDGKKQYKVERKLPWEAEGLEWSEWIKLLVWIRFPGRNIWKDQADIEIYIANAAMAQRTIKRDRLYWERQDIDEKAVLTEDTAELTKLMKRAKEIDDYLNDSSN